jgi:hypothetical protein
MQQYRAGNFLREKLSGEVFMISSVNETGEFTVQGLTDSMPLDQCEGVEIDFYWLNQFSFYDVSSSQLSIFFKDAERRFYVAFSKDRAAGHVTISYAHYEEKIQFVHELQNWFHQWTRKELVVKTY